MKINRIRKLLVAALAALLVMSIACAALADYDTIPYGEKSQRVRTLQSALKSKGFYRGTVDGKFGSGTKAAVRKFQASLGLTADGRPGNRTLTALYDGASAANAITAATNSKLAKPKNPNTLAYGQENSRVRSLQKALKAVGCYKGAIDGKYGDMTLAAVKRFQYSVGLHADGLAGVRTLNALNAKQTYERVSTGVLLSTGSTGDMVYYLQDALKDAGYSIADTEAGTFGTDTRAAVLAYQKSKGIEETGTVTESLYNKLTVKVPVTKKYDTLYPNTTSADVGAMKAKLITLKLLESGNTSDDYDDATVAAVKAFQSSYGLQVDGVAGNKTLTKLYQLVP